FIVRWPGKVPANTVSEQVICLADMVATFASVLNTPLPKGNAEDSFDALRAFTETKPGAPIRDHVILQSASAVYDLRMGDWKLIERADAPDFASMRNRRKTEAAEKRRKNAAKQHDELYNLETDPAEAKDALAGHTELAKKMKKLLDQAREQGFTRPGGGNPKSQTP